MSVSAGTFRWSDAYSVNVALLDEQHQHLFETIEELNQALQAGNGNSAIEPVLFKLVDYARFHFAAEESLMEQYDFPGLSTHRMQHEMFRRKINEFLSEHAAGKAGVAVSVMFFMRDWLKRHVMTTDKHYSAYLNARGIR